jgi:hypothetical protein
MANPVTSQVFNFQVVNKSLNNYVKCQFQSINPMAFYVHINLKLQGSILYTLGSFPSHIAYFLNVIIFYLRFT